VRQFGLGMMLLLSGCCVCSPLEEARCRAHSDAVDCGFAALGEDRTPIVECALDAQAVGGSAYGGWQVMGIDSEVRRYFALGGEQLWILLYDGGFGGACPVMTASPCDSELERFELDDGPSLSCVAGGAVTICDCMTCGPYSTLRPRRPTW
jgi:hypothetical protein